MVGALIIHKIVASWIASVGALRVSLLTSTANEITPSDSGVDSSWDCSRFDCVLVETLIS